MTRLLTTPVKGFRVVEHERLELTALGAAGDRDLFVVDDEGRLFSIGRSGAFASWTAAHDRAAGTLAVTGPDGRTLAAAVDPGERLTVDFWGSREVAGHVLRGPWSGWLSAIAGRPVRLVRTDRPGDAVDETPVTLLAEESVAEVARAAGAGPVDVRRFRMTITVSGVEPYQEEGWRDRTVRVGSALLRIQGPVPRCGATTRHPDSGKRDLRTLRMIDAARGVQPNDFGRGLNLGVYAQVLEPGTVSLGDVLTVR